MALLPRGKLSKPRARRRLPKVEAEAIFDTLGAANPAPKTELDFVNPYTLLVAVVLSAQATDAGVNRATRRLFDTVTTPQAMLELGLDGLKAHIRTIGLYNAKAANVIRLSEQLVALHGGEVPRTRAALEALPGVGRKTANVVLNEAFGEPTLAVDTHVFRVAHRIGFSKGRTPDAVEQDLVPQVPSRWAREAHHLLILHGRYLCKARTPECWRCPISAWCRYKPKTPPPQASTKTLTGRSAPGVDS